MLAAGFTTLEALKARLLPEAAADDSTWDEALSRLGLAVARRMEGHCARRFDRAVATMDEFSACALSAVLRRYPAEAITSLQLREMDGSTAAVVVGYSMDKACGLLDFALTPGTRHQRLIITYTGGYWLDDGSAMPEGATALPDDLLELWIAEVQAQAEARELFGSVSLRKETKTPNPARLTAATVEGLRPFRRFSAD